MNEENFWKVFDILVFSYLKHNRGTVAVLNTFFDEKGITNKENTEIVDFILKCEEIKEIGVEIEENAEDRFWEEVRKKKKITKFQKNAK